MKRNLPAEILQHIFLLLRQEDQIECMLTCRLWKNAIEDSGLFRTLHVYSYSFLEKLSKRIQEQPRLGNNVHHLSLHLFDSRDGGVFNVLEKMPNLQSFRTYGPSHTYHDTVSSLRLPWYQHIESIEEETASSIASYLLSNHVCPNLTDLRLFNCSTEIISLLKNAPALKSLFLEGMDINFDDIDQLHQNAPNLKILQLKNPTINSDRIETEIIPASSVTKLTLSGISQLSREMEINLLQFIPAKYPNLEELVYDICYPPGNRVEKELVYLEGWYSLLETLGTPLKKLHLNQEYLPVHFVSVLDMFKHEIEDLNVMCYFENPFSHFRYSQHKQYIRTLVLDHFRPRSFDWLKHLKVLETLEVKTVKYGNGQHRSVHLNFNDLASNCPPTLKSIALHKYVIDAEITSDRQYNVTNLTFVDCKLSEKVIGFIDEQFPLLTNLKVKDCEDLPKTLILRSATLESFCFIDTHKGGPNHVLVKTICDGEERLYFIEEKQQRNHSTICSYRELNPSDFPPVKSRPADNFTVKPDITLCCFTVKKVLVCR